MGILSSKSYQAKAIDPIKISTGFIKSTIIEKKNSISINLDSYDNEELVKHIDDQAIELGKFRTKLIKNVLNDNDFVESFNVKKLKDIYFIDSYCNSLLHIHNKSGTEPGVTNLVLTLNVNTLETFSKT